MCYHNKQLLLCLTHESVQSPRGPIIIMLLQLDYRQHSLLVQPGPDILMWTLW